MTSPTPSFECPAGSRRWRTLGVLCACFVLPACAARPADFRMTTPPTTTTTPAAASEAGAITAITLERDCSGCATGSRVELRRDGGAVVTVTGKARLGTQDQVSRARLTPADFDALARSVTAAGFFGMPATFEEPGLQDGAWANLGVARGAVVKQVFRRDAAGPAALKSLEAAVLALQARLVFVPDAR